MQLKIVDVLKITKSKTEITMYTNDKDIYKKALNDKKKNDLTLNTFYIDF